MGEGRHTFKLNSISLNFSLAILNIRFFLCPRGPTYKIDKMQQGCRRDGHRLNSIVVACIVLVDSIDVLSVFALKIFIHIKTF